MEKIVMLGTGSGMVIETYNTCFMLENNGKNFLVDTGGSIQIIKNLQDKGYNLSDIRDIFISHNHTDHILGFIWMFKKISVMSLNGEYSGKINLYCNSAVYESLKKLVSAVYPSKLQESFEELVIIHVLHDGEVLNIAGYEITFFDALAKLDLLYGFETILNNGAKLVFLGDETCNPALYDRIKGADYVMHEAFCLDSAPNVPQIVKDHHATVKFVCETMEPLNIKNLIIYHSSDPCKNRKELYTKEGSMYFNGNILIPDDLDEIILS